MSVAIANNKRGEEEKLAAALHQLKEEDPTVHSGSICRTGTNTAALPGRYAPYSYKMEAGTYLSSRCTLCKAKDCLPGNNTESGRSHLPP